MKKPKGNSPARPRNITDHDVMVVVDILERWGESKLTWELLAEEVQKHLFWLYTRQTLSSFVLISDAFAAAKKAQKFNGATKKKRSVSTVQKTSDDKIDSLKAKLRQKSDAYDKLAHQTATIIYNAGLLGITEQKLKRPMPSVDRDKTEL